MKKTCTKCDKSFPAISEYFQIVRNKKKGTQSLRSYCRSCERITSKTYRGYSYKNKTESEKDSLKKAMKKYQSSTKGKNNRKDWCKNNPDKWAKNLIYMKKYTKEYMRKDIINMGNLYIKSLIIQGTFLKSKDIPQDLIELKRKQVKLYRDVKNKNSNSN